VLRTGSNFESASMLPLDTAAKISSAPGIVRTPGGRSAVTADVVTSVNMPRLSGGGLRSLAVRGVGAENSAVRPEIVLVDGRLFEPGLREAIVGRSAQGEFAGLELGSTVELRDSVWTIVGAFTSGDATEAGLITDADTLASAYSFGFVNSVTVRLESPQVFDALEAAIDSDPTLTVDVYREPEYFVQSAENLDDLFFFVTYIVCSIMAAGALVGALNTMYAAVSSRSIEIATLRALGFGSFGIVVSVVVEALALALIGAAAGSAIAWALFSGDTITIGGGNGTIITTFAITPETLAMGLAWAGAVALIGALFPAMRAARLPLAAALRAF
jgi:putative ABC transport system permease protein